MLRLLKEEVDERSRIIAAQAGDEAARSWIVRQYSPAVYRFCLRMLRNDEDARDVAQEAMLKVMRSLDRVDPDKRFSTWVFGIARNSAIDAYRRRRHLSDEGPIEPADPSPSPLELSTRQERAERLQDAMDSLPPMYREVLVMYHFEHMKYREIADILDLPIGTVMNRIFRARERLRSAYEASEEAE